MTMEELNGLARERFVAAVGHAFEHSPWIAERTWAQRPFRDVTDLHAKMLAVLAAAAEAERLELLRAHPDLVGRLAREGRLTAASTGEQHAAGLAAVTPEEAAAFARNNARYRKKFEFPFVICAREHRKEAILAAFPRRLANTPAAEMETALAEVGKIARLRLLDVVQETSPMATLSRNYYGKEQVRLTKVVRRAGEHLLFEFNVKILLEGDFARVYRAGDNAACVPTDTMKNTVYALGKAHDFASPEQFAMLLARHFLENFAHVAAVSVAIEQILWERIAVAGKPHEHAFARGSNALRTATVKQDRANPPTVTGGIVGLEVVKTGQSAFEGFMVDPYTTLKPTTDRILGTSIEAVWTFAAPGVDYNGTFAAARRTILEVFATHQSLGVQHTLYAMGEALLAAAPAVSKVAFTMPNQHRILVNLEPLGMHNENDVFVSAAEPFGVIFGEVSRG